MMSLKILADYCVGTAESEVGAGFFNDIFVDSGEIEQIIDMLPGSPKILIGNKGTGKSLVFRKIENIFHEQKILSVYLTPRDIIHSDPSSETPAVLQSFYYDCLVRHVAITIGKNTDGLVGDDTAKLIQEAVISGDKNPDFIQKTLSLLQGIGTLITSRDFSAIPSKFGNTSTRCLSELIGKNLIDKKVFFLIIDEPDDVRLDGQGSSRIWALLHACRAFSQAVKNVRCLISLRSEVWHLLCEDPSGRKNIDQFSPLTIFLTPSENDIKNIIYKRLCYAASQINCSSAVSPYEFFFSGTSTQLPPPATVEKCTWEDYISKQSRGRPRDSIQLIRELALKARKNGKEYITEQEVKECATPFSVSRLQSLCTEYGSDFPDAERILTSFHLLQFESDAETIKQHLTKRIGEYNPTLRGRIIRNLPDGVFVLWRILHEMGFLNPRMPDASKTLGYRHISYNDNPHFVAQNNWNEMQKVCWEVHPAYRSYLYSLQDNEINRVAMIKEFKSSREKNPAFARRKRKGKRR